MNLAIQKNPIWAHAAKQAESVYRSHYDLPLWSVYYDGKRPPDYSKDPVTGIWRFKGTERTVCMGSFAAVTPCQAPGYRINLDELRYHQYAELFGRQMLNDYYAMMPLSSIERNKIQVFGNFGTACKMFIRPDSADKIFSGFLWNLVDNVNFEDGIPRRTLCIVSRPKQILGEWRFIVAQDGIMSGCCYMYQGNHVEIPSYTKDMESFVNGLIEKKFFPSEFMVYDVAELHDRSLALIEVNSFVTSAPYKNDLTRVFQRIQLA